VWVESSRRKERGNVCRGRSPASGGNKGDDRGTAATALGLGGRERERERIWCGRKGAWTRWVGLVGRFGLR
jgi:hypothetical protein